MLEDHPTAYSGARMSRPASSPPHRVGTLPPLPLLREPDVSGLALWAALFMAGSVLLAFLAAGPAHALPAAAGPETAAPESAAVMGREAAVDAAGTALGRQEDLGTAAER